MTSTRQTGNNFQDWIQKWLGDRGWVIHNQKGVATKVRTPRGEIWVSKRQDIYGCIDLIAKKAGLTLWIQATTHKSLKEKVKKIRAAKLTFSEFEFPMIFLKREGGIVDIYSLLPLNEEIASDVSPVRYGKIIRRKFYATEGVNWEF